MALPRAVVKHDYRSWQSIFFLKKIWKLFTKSSSAPLSVKIFFKKIETVQSLEDVTAMAFAESPAPGKDIVANNHNADRPLPKATLGKAFAEGKALFTERFGPKAKDLDQ